MGFNDRIDWTTFFTETAKNAFGQINVITRGATAAVFTHIRLDGNSHSREHVLTGQGHALEQFGQHEA